MRSASYNLGALQALQEQGVLARAAYLSSVSGGGYIAGAMTMVAASDDQNAVWGEGRPGPFAHLSPEERYLRNHSSYLAPDLNLKVKLVSRVALGFLVNASFLATILVIVGRLMGYLAAFIEPALIRGNEESLLLSWGAPNWRKIILMVAGGAILVGLSLVLTTVLIRFKSSPKEDRYVRTGKWLQGLGISAIFLFGILPSVLAGSRSLVTADLPVIDQPLAQTVVNVNEVKNAEARTVEEQGKGDTAISRFFRWLALLGLPSILLGAFRAAVKGHATKLATAAAYLVAPALIALGLLAASSAAAADGWGAWSTDSWNQLLWLLLPVAILALLFATSDLTATSLHPFYKRRLASAFALERVSADGDEDRCIDARERDYDTNLLLSATRPTKAPWPKLVCCAAANVSDQGATPPGRRAVTFTFEADRIGGPEAGYIPTAAYEKALRGSRLEDITLPAAIAISGAALSPSMGAMTKPSLTFLLALVNARLGVWLPSPAKVEALDAGGGAKASLSTLTRPRFTWLWREMRGRNELNERFLYVTDGGHWENLGLVELLRRGCTRIYCIDAAGDKEKTLFTIGEAISLARSELGVKIDLDLTALRPAAGSSFSESDHAIGSFTYPNGRHGVLAFCKAIVTEDAPWDVRAYKERDPRFPNHGLLKQMFADKTFESYRTLGYYTAGNAMISMGDSSA